MGWIWLAVAFIVIVTIIGTIFSWGGLADGLLWGMIATLFVIIPVIFGLTHASTSDIYVDNKLIAKDVWTEKDGNFMEYTSKWGVNNVEYKYIDLRKHTVRTVDYFKTW
jgi:hypothetical protein